jgi:uncharacterized protein (DUF1810 family)
VTAPGEADSFVLDRFVAAQDGGGTYERALAELQTGRKASHWIWFIFPQIAGLGMSTTARYYAISSIEEARAYLDHEVLGPRLLDCAEALLQFREISAEKVLGTLDAQKLRSSMTFFLRADPHCPVFAEVLDRYFNGDRDAATDRLL